MFRRKRGGGGGCGVRGERDEGKLGKIQISHLYHSNSVHASASCSPGIIVKNQSGSEGQGDLRQVVSPLRRQRKGYAGI